MTAETCRDHESETKLSKITRSARVQQQTQLSTISHQLSTVRKELSSNELGRTPSHRPDRLQADHQYTVPCNPVKAHFAGFSAGAADVGTWQNPTQTHCLNPLEDWP